MDINFNYWIYIILFSRLFIEWVHTVSHFERLTPYTEVCGFFLSLTFQGRCQHANWKWKKKTKTLIKGINKGPQTADPFTLNATLFFRSIDWCRCLWLELIQLDRGLLWFVRSAYFVLIFFFCILKSGTWKLCVQIILLWHWLM